MSCPIPGCTGHPRPGELLCGPHWRLVPYQLKSNVWTTWRFLRYGKPARTSSSTMMRRFGLRRYRAARQAAIDAVVRAESPLI